MFKTINTKKTNVNGSTRYSIKAKSSYKIYESSLYPSTFVYSRFPSKIQFLYYLLSSLPLNLDLQFTGKCFYDTFSDCRSIACTSFGWSSSCIRVLLGVLRKVAYCSRIKLKRLSFTTHFEIEILLPFTGCRKMLRKMPGVKDIRTT